MLAGGTGTGHLFPNDGADTAAAIVGMVARAMTTMTSPALASQRAAETQPAVGAVGVPSRRRLGQ